MSDPQPMDVVRQHLANLEQHPEWRRGQSLFNALSAVRPELAEKLWAQGPDPFYLDDRLDEALLWIDQHWKDEDD